MTSVSASPSKLGSQDAASAGRNVTFEGRVLFLTEDAGLLWDQLAGKKTLASSEVLAEGAPLPLLSNISTDELTPGWVCYYYDETLARYCLVGLRGGGVEREASSSAASRRGAARAARRPRTASSRVA